MERKHPLAECESCPLNRRGKYVPTEFPAESSNGAIIIGEAPGKEEAESARPFVGISGRVLDSLLSHYGLDRRETTLTNVVACRPQGNATPTAEAIRACSGRLEAEITQASPRVAIALGNTAASAILGRDTAITRDRIGPPRDVEGRPYKVVPTIHPAACLRHADHFPNLVTDMGKAVNVLQGVTDGTKWTPPMWKAYDTPQEAIKVASALMKYDRLVLDIETGTDKDGEGGHPTRLRCIGFAYAKGKAVVLGEECLKDPAVRKAVYKLLSKSGLQLICQNGKFDLSVLRMMGLIDLAVQLYDDTMLMNYALDERGGVHSLDHMGQEYLGTPNWKGVISKHGGYDKCPPDILYEYNAYDVAVTWDVCDLLQSKLQKPEHQDSAELYRRLIRVSNALMQVEAGGFAVELETAEKFDIEFKEEIEDLVGEINLHLGLEEETILKGRKGAKYEVQVWPFNPNSPQQVTQRLKEHYGVRVKSTNEKTLLDLAAKKKNKDDLITFLELLLSIRKVQKQHGTYVKGVLKRQAPAPQGAVSPGRVLIHPTFKIHGTTTGRLSCANPNVQNVPRPPKD